MDANFLQLNGSKTEVILIGIHQTKKIGNNHIVINGLVVPLSSLVTNLGITFDSFLSFEAHIKRVCQTSLFQLRNIARLRSSMHAFISSRLNCRNLLFIGLPVKSLQKLKYVQNSIAWVLTKTNKIEHIPPVLASLHWMPVKYRTKFKNFTFAF